MEHEITFNELETTSTRIASFANNNYSKSIDVVLTLKEIGGAHTEYIITVSGIIRYKTEYLEYAIPYYNNA